VTRYYSKYLLVPLATVLIGVGSPQTSFGAGPKPRARSRTTDLSPVLATAHRYFSKATITSNGSMIGVQARLTEGKHKARLEIGKATIQVKAQTGLRASFRLEAGLPVGQIEFDKPIRVPRARDLAIKDKGFAAQLFAPFVTERRDAKIRGVSFRRKVKRGRSSLAVDADGKWPDGKYERKIARGLLPPAKLTPVLPVVIRHLREANVVATNRGLRGDVKTREGHIGFAVEVGEKVASRLPAGQITIVTPSRGYRLSAEQLRTSVNLDPSPEQRQPGSMMQRLRHFVQRRVVERIGSVDLLPSAELRLGMRSKGKMRVDLGKAVQISLRGFAQRLGPVKLKTVDLAEVGDRIDATARIGLWGFETDVALRTENLPPVLRSLLKRGETIPGARISLSQVDLASAEGTLELPSFSSRLLNFSVSRR
jgi:hypothetical protein